MKGFFSSRNSDRVPTLTMILKLLLLDCCLIFLLEKGDFVTNASLASLSSLNRGKAQLYQKRLLSEGKNDGTQGFTTGSSTGERENQAKVANNHRICTIPGGAEVGRFASSKVRNLFRAAIDDVEFMREYVTESLFNGGLAKDGGTAIHNLEELSRTLDWETRGLPENWTTLDAGLGYVDDRPDRHVDRYVSLLHEPHIGNKSTDLAMADTVSKVLPWIADRMSTEDSWWIEHQNGRSEGKDKQKFLFKQLYVSSYFQSWGNVLIYYPPYTAAYGKGKSFGDVVGPEYECRDCEYVAPTLRENNPGKHALVGTPYADRAHVGLSILTVHAPVYYTGEWYGFQYNDTYIGLTAVDVSIGAISELLKELDGSVTKNSFAFVVDSDFSMYVITQYAVDRIYPAKTDHTEKWVFRDIGTNSIVEDRRNQSFLVTDTIHHTPTELSNADWKGLHKEILHLSPGERGVTDMDITLTGDTLPTHFSVMYDRWDSVADWFLLLFTPADEVKNAINCTYKTDAVFMEVEENAEGEGQTNFLNNGLLDVRVTLGNLPTWIRSIRYTSSQYDHLHHLTEHELDANNSMGGPFEVDKTLVVPAGESVTFYLIATTESLEPGTTSSVITLHVEDNDYPDCYFSKSMSATVTVKVVLEESLNLIENARYYVYVLSGILIVTSIACGVWVMTHSKSRIIAVSQPIFLYMLCCGTFVMGISTLPLSIDDSLANKKTCDAACMAFPWLAALGFSIAFSALFSKVWRVNQIFEASVGFKRKQVSVADVMIPFCSILTLNIILLLLWTFIAPLHWTRVSNGENSSYGTCWFGLTKASTAFVSLLAMLNMLAVIMANVQAYRARKMPDQFSESKYIAFAMGSMLQVFVISLPVMFIVNESPPAFLFVQSSMIFLIAMSLLLLIFVPKLLFMYSTKHNENTANERISTAASNYVKRKKNRNTEAGTSQQQTSCRIHHVSGLGASGLSAQSNALVSERSLQPPQSSYLSYPDQGNAELGKADKYEQKAQNTEIERNKIDFEHKLKLIKERMEDAGINADEYFKDEEKLGFF